MNVLMPHCGMAANSTSGGEVSERETLARLPRYGVAPLIVRPRWRGLRWWNSRAWFPAPTKRPDLIRAHSLRYTGLPALRWGRRLGCPVTVHYHHLDPDSLSWLDWYVLNRADHITTDSEFSKSQAEDAGRRARIDVVRLGVDHQRFRPTKMPAGQIVLLVGGNKPRKNTRFVKALWPEVVKEVPGAELHEMGQGTGLSDGDVAACYRQARVVAMPSRLEGFGLPVLEAMASARPVVLSNHGALPEFDLETTELIPRAWVWRLVDLLTNDGLWAQEAGRNLALAQSYSWERTAQRFAELWRAL